MAFLRIAGYFTDSFEKAKLCEEKYVNTGCPTTELESEEEVEGRQKRSEEEADGRRKRTRRYSLFPQPDVLN